MFHKLINKIKLFNTSMLELSEWYFVAFDDTHIHVRANPPHREGWAYSFLWNDIERVCFEDNGLSASDCLYIRIKGQEQSYQIPTEAHGSDELFLELNRRGLFPDDLMKQATYSTDGGLYCYPTLDIQNSLENQKDEPNIYAIIFYVIYVGLLILALSKLPVSAWTWWQIFYAMIMLYLLYFAPSSWRNGRNGDAVVALVVIFVLIYMVF